MTVLFLGLKFKSPYFLNLKGIIIFLFNFKKTKLNFIRL